MSGQIFGSRDLALNRLVVSGQATIANLASLNTTNISTTNITTSNIHIANIRGVGNQNIDLHNDIQPISDLGQNLGTTIRRYGTVHSLNFASTGLVSSPNLEITNASIANLRVLNNSSTANLQVTNLTVGNIRPTNIIANSSANILVMPGFSTLGEINLGRIDGVQRFHSIRCINNSFSGDNYLHFLVSTNVTTQSLVCSMLGNQRVGIATSTPATTLDVNGTTASTLYSGGSLAVSGGITSANLNATNLVSTNATFSNIAGTTFTGASLGVNSITSGSLSVTNLVATNTTTTSLNVLNSTFANIATQTMRAAAGNIDVISHLQPLVTNITDLGTVSRYWNNAYINNLFSLGSNSYKSFTKGSATLTSSTFTRAPIFVGGGGSWDPGTNRVGVPSAGLYEISFLSVADTDAFAGNTIRYRLRNHSTSSTVSGDYSHICGGPASIDTQNIRFTFEVTSGSHLFEIEVRRTTGDVTNWIISDGWIRRLVATA